MKGVRERGMRGKRGWRDEGGREVIILDKGRYGKWGKGMGKRKGVRRGCGIRRMKNVICAKAS